MAEENNEENGKKSPIKLILMIVGGIVLLGAGLGIGILVGGGESSDPSTESIVCPPWTYQSSEPSLFS